MIEQIQKKIKEEFEALEFEEDIHCYFVKKDGIRQRPASVSRLVERFSEKVDFNQKAIGVAKREGVTPAVILKRWKDNNTESIDKGHDTHAYAENDTKEKPLVKDRPEKIAAKKFLDWLEGQNRYVVVAKEVRMYHKDLMYAGTCDLILLDTWTGTLILVDYKTNKDIWKNFKGKLMLPPFHNIVDCPYNKYQIQLSLYQILLEQIGIPVTERWLVWLKPDEDYELIQTHDFTNTLTQWMEEKSFVIR